jgi:hypothetical protein
MTLSSATHALRHSLLELHRTIVAAERVAYERRAGQVNAAAFLRVLIEDEAYGWLRPLSALILRMDEDTEEPAAEAEAEILAGTRALVRPDPAGNPFQQRYARLVEQSPDVAYAHGTVVQALKRPAAALLRGTAAVH